MEEMTSRVYIKTDADGKIIRCDGGYTTPLDLIGWIEIDKGYGDRFNLCQTHYFDGGLYTDDGFCRYKYVDDVIVLRTPEEIEADRLAIPPIPVSPTNNELMDAILELAELIIGGTV